MDGWQCPVCQEVMSPFQRTCVNGPHTESITTTSLMGFNLRASKAVPPDELWLVDTDERGNPRRRVVKLKR